MYISKKLLQKSEGKISEKIRDLEKKISSNQGEIILTSREIILKKHNHCFGSYSNSINYIETGIINGKLKQLNETLNLELTQTINHIGLRDSNHLVGNYMYLPSVQIPVKNKLSKNRWNFNLRFLIQDLENFKKKGVIGIERSEFDLGLRRGNYSNIDMPYLSNMQILIGNEIRDYAKEKCLEENIEGFFNLMKNSGIEERINQHYYNKRQEIGGELIQNIAQLSIFNNKIKKLEKNVLSANFTHYSRDEGEWNNFGNYVNEYEKIIEGSKKLFNEIKKNIKDSQKVELTKLLEIDMRVIGLSQTINTIDFLSSVSNVCSDYSKRVEELDNHINNQLRG